MAHVWSHKNIVRNIFSLVKINFCCVKNVDWHWIDLRNQREATRVSLNFQLHIWNHILKVSAVERRNNVKSCSEDILLVNSKKYEASTLWTIFSMLKATLKKHSIADYMYLESFLKRKSGKYTPKKSKIFFLRIILRKFLEISDLSTESAIFANKSTY